MNKLIVRLYRAGYNVTGFRTISFAFAVGYISLLNMVTIYGMGLLLQGLFPTAMVLHLFRAPYIFFTAALIVGLNIFTAPSIHNIAVQNRRRARLGPVLLYSVLCMLLYTYSQVYDRLF